MATLDDVVEAFRAIERAEVGYREALRSALAAGVSQADIAKALNRTREMLRRDAMTEEKRAALRRVEAERARERRHR